MIRVTAQIDFQKTSAHPLKVGDRQVIYTFWSELRRAFGLIFLEPNWLSDRELVHWIWQQQSERVEISSSAIAEARSALQDAIEVAQQEIEALKTSKNAKPSISRIRARAIGIQCAEDLLERSDEELCGFLCDTSHGIRIHSWGSQEPADMNLGETYGHPVTGTLVLNSRSPREVTILLLNMSGAERGRTHPNHDGRYRLESVVRGDYQLTFISNDGKALATGRSITMEDRAIEVEAIELEPAEIPFQDTEKPEAGNIKIAMTGKESANASVRWELYDRDGHLLQSKAAGEDGVCHFDSLKPGEYSINGIGSGVKFSKKREDLQVFAGETTHLNVSVGKKFPLISLIVGLGIIGLLAAAIFFLWPYIADYFGGSDGNRDPDPYEQVEKDDPAVVPDSKGNLKIPKKIEDFRDQYLALTDWPLVMTDAGIASLDMPLGNAVTEVTDPSIELMFLKGGKWAEVSSEILKFENWDTFKSQQFQVKSTESIESMQWTAGEWNRWVELNGEKIVWRGTVPSDIPADRSSVSLAVSAGTSQRTFRFEVTDPTVSATTVRLEYSFSDLDHWKDATHKTIEVQSRELWEQLKVRCIGTADHHQFAILQNGTGIKSLQQASISTEQGIQIAEFVEIESGEDIELVVDDSGGRVANSKFRLLGHVIQPTDDRDVPQIICVVQGDRFEGVEALKLLLDADDSIRVICTDESGIRSIQYEVDAKRFPVTVERGSKRCEFLIQNAAELLEKSMIRIEVVDTSENRAIRFIRNENDGTVVSGENAAFKFRGILDENTGDLVWELQNIEDGSVVRQGIAADLSIRHATSSQWKIDGIPVDEACDALSIELDIPKTQLTQTGLPKIYQVRASSTGSKTDTDVSNRRIITSVSKMNGLNWMITSEAGISVVTFDNGSVFKTLKKGGEQEIMVVVPEEVALKSGGFLRILVEDGNGRLVTTTYLFKDASYSKPKIALYLKRNNEWVSLQKYSLFSAGEDADLKVKILDADGLHAIGFRSVEGDKSNENLAGTDFQPGTTQSEFIIRSIVDLVRQGTVIVWGRDKLGNLGTHRLMTVNSEIGEDGEFNENEGREEHHFNQRQPSPEADLSQNDSGDVDVETESEEDYDGSSESEPRIIWEPDVTNPFEDDEGFGDVESDSGTTDQANTEPNLNPWNLDQNGETGGTNSGEEETPDSESETQIPDPEMIPESAWNDPVSNSGSNSELQEEPGNPFGDTNENEAFELDEENAQIPQSELDYDNEGGHGMNGHHGQSGSNDDFGNEPDTENSGTRIDPYANRNESTNGLGEEFESNQEQGINPKPQPDTGTPDHTEDGDALGEGRLGQGAGAGSGRIESFRFERDRNQTNRSGSSSGSGLGRARQRMEISGWKYGQYKGITPTQPVPQSQFDPSQNEALSEEARESLQQQTAKTIQSPQSMFQGIRFEIGSDAGGTDLKWSGADMEGYELITDGTNTAEIFWQGNASGLKQALKIVGSGGDVLVELTPSGSENSNGINIDAMFGVKTVHWVGAHPHVDDLALGKEVFEQRVKWILQKPKPSPDEWREIWRGKLYRYEMPENGSGAEAHVEISLVDMVSKKQVTLELKRKQEII